MPKKLLHYLMIYSIYINIYSKLLQLKMTNNILDDVINIYKDNIGNNFISNLFKIYL